MPRRDGARPAAGPRRGRGVRASSTRRSSSTSAAPASPTRPPAVYGDELVVNAAAAGTNVADRRDGIVTFLPAATRGRGRSGGARALRLSRMTQGSDSTGGSRRRHARSGGRRLGGSACRRVSSAALDEVFEAWNGQGRSARAARARRSRSPAGSPRLGATVAHFDARSVAPRSRMRAVEERAGGLLDPALAAAFLARAGDPGGGGRRRSRTPPSWTPSRRRPGTSRPPALAEVAAAFGDIADLKSPYMLGHSSGVATLAGDAGGRLGLDDAAQRAAPGRRPAPRPRARGHLGRDLGAAGPRLSTAAVGAGPAPCLPLGADPRALGRRSRPMAEMVGMHHERLDGSGYHRGSRAREIPMPARILAAADAYQAMTQDRGRTGAMPADVAADRVRDDVRAGRLDGDAAAAVLEAAGQARRRRATGCPPGSASARSRCSGRSPRVSATARSPTGSRHLAADRRAPRPAHLHEARRVEPRGCRPVRDGARPARLMTAGMGRSTDARAPADQARPTRARTGPSPLEATTDGTRRARRESRTRLFTPAFIALSLAELAYFTAAGLTIPVTPLFAHGPLGATEVGVGLAVGAFTRHGARPPPVRRTPVGPGRAATAARRRRAGLRGRPGAPTPSSTSLPVLVGLRLLLGVAEAFFFVAGFAAVADLAPPGRAGEALSFNSLSLYLGRRVRSARRPGAARRRRVRDGLARRCRAGARRGRPGVADPGDRERAAPGTPARRRSSTARRSRPRSRCSPGSSGWAASSPSWRSTRPRTSGLDGASGVLFLFGLIVVVDPGRVRPAARSRPAVPARRRRPGPDRRRPARRERRRDGARARSPGRPSSPPAWRSLTPAFFAAIFARVEPSQRGLGVGDGEPVHRPRVRRRADAARAGRRVARDPRGVRGRGVDRRAGRDRIGRPRAPRCAEPAVGGAAGALGTVR